MTRAAIFALPLLLGLAACGGGGGKAEQAADQLEKAAAQSDPTSAAVLENAADDVRATGNTMALGQPGSPAQQALEKAANASADTTGDTPTRTDATPADTSAAGKGATPAPPPKQALPNYDGQRLNRDENGNFKPRPKIIPPNARD